MKRRQIHGQIQQLFCPLKFISDATGCSNQEDYVSRVSQLKTIRLATQHGTKEGETQTHKGKMLRPQCVTVRKEDKLEFR